jgi:hypothetical protein
MDVHISLNPTFPSDDTFLSESLLPSFSPPQSLLAFLLAVPLFSEPRTRLAACHLLVPSTVLGRSFTTFRFERTSDRYEYGSRIGRRSVENREFERSEVFRKSEVSQRDQQDDNDRESDTS